MSDWPIERPLDERLAQFFVQEIAGAGAEWPARRGLRIGHAAAPVGPVVHERGRVERQPRTKWRVWGQRLALVAAAAVIVALLSPLSGLLGPAWPATSSPNATVLPKSPSPSPTLESVIPASIDGQTVYLGADIDAHARDHPGSFLAGGWLIDPYANADCAKVFSVETAPAPFGACPERLQPTRQPDAARPAGGAIYFLDPLPEPGLPDRSVPVVLRVHSRDPRCIADAEICAEALVVEAVVWHASTPLPSPTPDPLAIFPKSVDGQPVLFGEPMYEYGRTHTGSFLAGGWFENLELVGATCNRLVPESVLPGAAGCERDLNSADPASATTWSAAILLDPGQSTARLGIHGPQPVVLRVHTKDPILSRCAAPDVSMCEYALVVDAVVWVQGTEASPTRP